MEDWAKNEGVYLERGLQILNGTALAISVAFIGQIFDVGGDVREHALDVAVIFGSGLLFSIGLPYLRIFVSYDIKINISGKYFRVILWCLYFISIFFSLIFFVFGLFIGHDALDAAFG